MKHLRRRQPLKPAERENMKTINELKTALQNDRAGFIKGLIAAGYVETVVLNLSNNDNELIRLATEIYNDVWKTFDVKEFESWIYNFA
jgi:hypothetical protein